MLTAPAAFIKHDEFQSGSSITSRCMSDVAINEEAKAGSPSAATADFAAPSASDLSAEKFRAIERVPLSLRLLSKHRGRRGGEQSARS